MAKAVFDEIKKSAPKNHFTVGIHDDVTHTSLDYDSEFSTEDPGTVRALFYGLGSDGTVGANKNSIKIIGKNTDNYAQGYFVYDSKKAGSVTVSHLRFGPRPIRSSYLITRASFVACHQFQFIERTNVLDCAEPGATFLLNAPFGADEIWNHLPQSVQETIIQKKLKFYLIDAYKVARETEMGNRINTIMQTCFFAISGVLPREQAIEAIKNAIRETYGKRGEAVVAKNFVAVDHTLSHLHQVTVPVRGDQRVESSASCPRAGAGVCAGRDWPHDRGTRRRSSRKCNACGRHVPDRHSDVGEAKYRATDSGLGRTALHSVWQMRVGLSPRGHSGQGLRLLTAGRMRRQGSSRKSRAGANSKISVTRFRFLRKTAPDANFASRSAR